MTEPLRIAFDLDCSAEHAFAVWTARIGTWWPVDHTVTGQADADIVLQPGVGGRIYERTADGTEHEWGRVTLWEPPARLAYTWHLLQHPVNATEVEIRFLERGGATVRVEIEHRGWERLGTAGEERRAQNRGGWEALLPYYRAAIEKGDS